MLMIVGDNDWLVSPKDFKLLHEVLPETVQVLNVADFNHLDCVWGMDATDVMINNQIFAFLESL